MRCTAAAPHDELADSQLRYESECVRACVREGVVGEEEEGGASRDEAARVALALRLAAARASLFTIQSSSKHLT